MVDQIKEPVRLPVTFDRPLSLFAYVIAHGQVLFRGEQDVEAGRPTTLEVLFKNVGALSVGMWYRTLTIRTASPAEEERALAADPDGGRDRRVFILETESGGVGHVVAGALYWAESSAPADYSSFLIPDHELPKIRLDGPAPARPAVVRTPLYY
ncbi:hypothetical protein ACIRRH_09465 [Kitasatospora sp. NPDC101235]|uniref:hypothetical protein n=1 Tax=Kitasatospora sp. NPDC101235 TaxID=3364101 RepID=UPI0037FE7728